MVIDDTSSPAFLRDEWRAVAAGAGVEMVLVHVRLGQDEQRARVAVTRAHQDRPDVLDSVLEQHRAAFEAPTDAEAALIVEGVDSRSSGVLDRLVSQVRARTA